MSGEPMTWSRYLDEFCLLLGPEQKRAFEEAIEADGSSLARWRKGEKVPRTEHLTHLYEALPEERRAPFLLLLQQDPFTWAKVSDTLRSTIPQILQPNEEQENDAFLSFHKGELDPFFLTLFRLQRNSSDRFWQVASRVLREVIARLETHPEHTGIVAALATCMPPKQGKVRSLRAVIAQGTPPWPNYPHSTEYLLGAESLAGHVVMKRHSDRVPDLNERVTIPVHRIDHEQSVAACPLMSDLGVAGALVVSSVQPGFFTAKQMELLELFADFMRLALYDTAYYPASDIELRLMPAFELQNRQLQTFQQRVEAEYRRRSNPHGQSLKNLTGVEEHVREQIEDEFLRLAREQPSSNGSGQ